MKLSTGGVAVIVNAIIALLIGAAISGSVVVAAVMGTRAPNVPDNRPPLPGDFIPYQMVPKSLYVWSHTTESQMNGQPAWTVLLQNRNQEIPYLIEFCKLHGVKEVYLFVGSIEWEYDAFFSTGKFPHEESLVHDLELLSSAGIGASLMVYLNDDPENLANWERMKGVASAMRRLKDSYPALALKSLHIDQEPAQPANYANYIKMLLECSSEVHVSAAIKPKWTRDSLASIEGQFSLESLSTEYPVLAPIVGTAQLFSDVVYFVTEYSVMMAYSNDLGSVISLGSRAMESARRMGSTFAENAIETGFVNNLPAEETLYYEIQKNKEKWYSDFLTINTGFNGYGIAQQTVIHDYAQYFYALYCVVPEAKPRLDGAAYLDCPSG